jgi:hypothetical protein
MGMGDNGDYMGWGGKLDAKGVIGWLVLTAALMGGVAYMATDGRRPGKPEDKPEEMHKKLQGLFNDPQKMDELIKQVDATGELRNELLKDPAIEKSIGKLIAAVEGKASEILDGKVEALRQTKETLPKKDWVKEAVKTMEKKTGEPQR